MLSLFLSSSQNKNRIENEVLKLWGNDWLTFPPLCCKSSSRGPHFSRERCESIFMLHCKLSSSSQAFCINSQINVINFHFKIATCFFTIILTHPVFLHSLQLLWWACLHCSHRQNKILVELQAHEWPHQGQTLVLRCYTMLCFFMSSNSLYYKEKAGKRDDKVFMLDIPETTFWSLLFLHDTDSLKLKTFGVADN